MLYEPTMPYIWILYRNRYVEYKKFYECETDLFVKLKNFVWEAWHVFVEKWLYKIGPNLLVRNLFSLIFAKSFRNFLNEIFLNVSVLSAQDLIFLLIYTGQFHLLSHAFTIKLIVQKIHSLCYRYFRYYFHFVIVIFDFRFPVFSEINNFWIVLSILE